jgi:CRISPR-associated protein Cmr6
MTPIPKYQQELLKKDTTNFSLVFPRLMEWQEKDGKITKIDDEDDDKKNIHNKGSVSRLHEKGNSCLHNPELAKVLEKIHRGQTEILSDMEKSGLKILTSHAKLVSPFISGLGSGHPNETGMILDRNTGCPFLPASSIKGVLRMAYALNLAGKDKNLVDDKGNLDDALLRKYFGDLEDKKYCIPPDSRTRGQLVILDAYPLTPPELKIDIMNPHYRKYYEQKESPKKYVGPVETASPFPIKFLSIRERSCVFVFRCFLLPLFSGMKNDNTFTDEDIDTVHAMFKTAFSTLGFGGKTAIGYGRFQEIPKEEATKSLQPQKTGTLVTLKIGKIYSAVLTEIKKEKWRVVLKDYPEKKGVILNSIPTDKKISDVVQVRLKAETSTNCNFEYIEG